MHSGLTIKQVVTGKADIVISFETKRHYILHGLFCHMDFDGPGGTIGHAFYPLKNIGEPLNFSLLTTRYAMMYYLVL